MHFLCVEPRETDKNVLKFSKNWVLKFHFLLLGALILGDVSPASPVELTAVSMHGVLQIRN